MNLCIRHYRSACNTAGSLVRKVQQEGAFVSSTIERFQGCQISNKDIDAEKIEYAELCELVRMTAQVLIQTVPSIRKSLCKINEFCIGCVKYCNLIKMIRC